jgi:hypothetical protein
MKLKYAFIMLLFAQCGYYSFSGSTLPSHLKTIAIPVFDDQTAEFGIREALTDAVINGITRDNTLKISDPRNADSMLEGTILTIRDEAGTVSVDEEVKDIKVYLTLDVRFVDMKKREALWEERITQWGTYEPASANGRTDAIDEIIDKVSEDILNKIIAGW